MLLIYTPEITPRTEYVFDLVFKTELGIEYSVTTYRHRFEGYSQEKINYSPAITGDEVFIGTSGLLAERSIEKKDIPVQDKDGVQVLFPQDTPLGFDVFAAVFYMVSRYEEYLPFTADTHGRFKASSGIAYQNNFLQLPIVNIWIGLLKKVLQQKYPGLAFRTQKFRSILTYDIDIAYAYHGRNRLRTAGSVAKDIAMLNFKNILQRVSSLSSKKDPWDIYDELLATLKAKHLDSIFFILLADYSWYNRNLPYDHPLMIELVKKIAGSQSLLGLHASYKSPEKPEKIVEEKERLEKLSGIKISKNRQHFLRFKLPETFKKLVAAGITEDYSMVFADMPGFRAGTCNPFYFYDLSKERVTALKIFPAACMDANFFYYSKSSPSKSMEAILSLLDSVKKINGTFISIWHNDIISGTGKYTGWKSIHEEVIKQLPSNHHP